MYVHLYSPITVENNNKEKKKRKTENKKKTKITQMEIYRIQLSVRRYLTTNFRLRKQLTRLLGNSKLNCPRRRLGLRRWSDLYNLVTWAKQIMRSSALVCLFV